MFAFGSLSPGVSWLPDPAASRRFCFRSGDPELTCQKQRNLRVAHGLRISTYAGEDRWAVPKNWNSGNAQSNVVGLRRGRPHWI